MTKFKIGDRVEWCSSNTNKAGVVVAIVPAGADPKGFGYKVDQSGMPRKHESYIIEGRAIRGPWDSTPRKGVYWPLVSLLRPASIAGTSA